MRIARFIVPVIALAGGAAEAQPSAPPNAEGLAAHDVKAVRDRYHATGAGMTVCVISDSADYLTQAQSPPRPALGTVDIVPGQANLAPPSGPVFGNSGEGTAMLEIIHSIAPAAALKFATSFPTSYQAVDNYRAFVRSGCTIIVDDITYLDESPFEYGPLSRAVQAASDKGILTISSAGNLSNATQDRFTQTWEGDSNLSPDKFVYFWPNQVSNGVALLPPAPPAQPSPQAAFLWWSDNSVRPLTNFYLISRDAQGRILTDARGKQIGLGMKQMAPGRNPVQAVPIVDQGSLQIVPSDQAGFDPAARRFLHLYVTDGARLQYSTGGAVLGHNAVAAATALSIGALTARGATAAFTGGPGIVADAESSDGPRRMFWDVNGNPLVPGGAGGPNLSSTGGIAYQKPDLLAADCLSTTVPGLAPYCGTSAAAAEAAGIAALAWSLSPSLPAARIKALLLQTALPVGAPGAWNPASGRGIAMPGPVMELLPVGSADFSGPSARFTNAGFSRLDRFSYPANTLYTCWMLGGSVSLIMPGTAGQALKLQFDHMGRGSGVPSNYAPVTIDFNGVRIATGFDVTQHHPADTLFSTDYFPVPAAAVQASNTVSITVDDPTHQHTDYCLHTLRLLNP